MYNGMNFSKNKGFNMKMLQALHVPGIGEIAKELCNQNALELVLHKTLCNAAMPSPVKLEEIISRIKAVIFPGYFGPSRIHVESLGYHVTANLDSIYRMLAEQIRRGGCFANVDFANDCRSCDDSSMEIALEFLSKLPEIRRLLVLDANAAYEGDPAAISPGEAIFCYPSMLAMTHHRIAHELYKLNVPIIPRMVSEMAHAHTGIDIHPGATIGESFFIDHGTGVVIGETCIIGSGCRLYQGVTLGALSFDKTEDGTLVKGIARHPILEDNVTVYAGASILGRITIGADSVIGGNVWLTRSVPVGGKIVQSHHGAKAHANEPLKGSTEL